MPLTAILIIFGLLLFTALYYRHHHIILKRELLNEKEQFRSVISSTNDAIIITNSESKVISWNKGAEKIFGFLEEEILGENLNTIIPDRYRKAHESGTKRFLSTDIPKVIGQTVELQGLKKGGGEVPIELSLSSWKKDEEVYFSGIIRDITERKQAEEMINFLAFHDELTKLPNRRLFTQIIEEEMEKAKLRGESLVIFFVDLDKFKEVNDTYGHHFGDLLLIEIANRLNAVIEDKGFAARLGGDEFSLIMTRVKDSANETKHMAEQIKTVLTEPAVIEGREIPVSASVGIASYPEHGNDIDTLMRNADMAMYLAKKKDKVVCK